MNEVVQFPALYPALPEIVLALGAMALLMFGVEQGERSAPLVNWLAVALLVVAALIIAANVLGFLIIPFLGEFVRHFSYLLALPLIGARGSFEAPGSITKSCRSEYQGPLTSGAGAFSFSCST